MAEPEEADLVAAVRLDQALRGLHAGPTARDEIARHFADHREAAVLELAETARFLLARIDNLDWCDFDRLCNDWSGHVDPPLSRMRKLLELMPNGR